MKIENPTNQEVFSKGEIVDDWASDVGGSNESRDNIIEYKGTEYLITTDFAQEKPLFPEDKAEVYDTERFCVKCGKTSGLLEDQDICYTCAKERGII